MRIGWKYRNDYVRPIVPDNFGQALAGWKEPAQAGAKFFLFIDPGIERCPGVGQAIDRAEVGATHHRIDKAKCFGKNVADLNLGFGGYLQKSLANSARGAVVSFAESGGENENFFHVRIRRGEFNG